MKKNVIAALFLYLVSTGVSFAAFRAIAPNQDTIRVETPRTADAGLNIDPGEPKTETCPLNGALHTKTEKDVWDKRRPLAVMIENHEEARPQSGLSKADVVYEAIAEGGITRFMAVFYCDAVAKDVLVAPVRSARIYFMNWAAEYGEYPLYAHVGGANCSADPGTGRCKTDKRVQAIELIEQYGWGGRKGNDLNQFSIGYPTYYRDYDRLGRTVATEHTMVSSTEKLWSLAKQRGWTNESPEGEDWTSSFKAWSFGDPTSESQRGSTSTIAFDFWDGFKQYDARWEYDRSLNVYKRLTGGQPHKDLNSNEQITSTNVIVQFVKEEGPVDELKHMYYETIGKGEALIFSEGRVEEAQWNKKARTDRTLFTDSKGKELKLTRGKVWIEVVAPDTKINY